MYQENNFKLFTLEQLTSQQKGNRKRQLGARAMAPKDQALVIYFLLRSTS